MNPQQTYTQPQGYAPQGPFNQGGYSQPYPQQAYTYVPNQPQWNASYQQPFCCDHHRHNGGNCDGWNRPTSGGIIGAVVNEVLGGSHQNGYCCDHHHHNGGYCQGHNDNCCHHHHF
jgi:hypothetical protein